MPIIIKITTSDITALNNEGIPIYEKDLRSLDLL
jgi:hypothetical protein